MYFEFENTLEALWFKTLGHALEHAHKTGNRLVRVLDTKPKGQNKGAKR